MKVKTARLTMRPFEQDDFADTFAIYQRADVCRYLLHEPWTTENAQAAFTKKIQAQQLTQETSLQIAVCLQETVIGGISVFYTEMRETLEIGYVFHPAYSGKGLATEALRTVITELFQEYTVHCIQAILDERNQASEKICLRLGMRKEGDFKEDFWNKGEWSDTLVYGILAKEWQNETIRTNK